ncbi:olfactory receptor 11A1-like [Trachemys scripta elegans]|uniref:olfactory receptor 11A1-like n=1 Tax=Trachemys scripta elegans TaxID=31138 RepID=UPI001554CAC8|nr:olfactory receptor 11A1-like [Trachemys scripta elegans]
MSMKKERILLKRMKGKVHLVKKCKENQTEITEFILVGFSSTGKLQIVLFWVFLATYLVTIIGNLLIVITVLTDRSLRTPMYFFLGNLSFLEIWYATNLVPRLLFGMVTKDNVVSFAGCMMQFYLFGALAVAECLLLTVMSYDRYLAICKPLHYMTLMDGKVCTQLSAGSWASGFIGTSITVCLLSNLNFSGPNEIDHFFCDITSLIKVSCSDTYLVEIMVFSFSSAVSLIPFLLILTSYICILRAILRIPSDTGRQKAFSTCSSHLIIVSTFYGTLIAMYVVPSAAHPLVLNKVISLLYTVVTPMLNPIVYSLKNKEVHEALKKLLSAVLVATRRL